MRGKEKEESDWLLVVVLANAAAAVAEGRRVIKDIITLSPLSVGVDAAEAGASAAAALEDANLIAAAVLRRGGGRGGGHRRRGHLGGNARGGRRRGHILHAAVVVEVGDTTAGAA